MTRRVHNFGAGPAALPASAIEHAREDLVDFEGTGMSAMEISHRHSAYEKVQTRAVALLRSLMGIPDTHEVLLLHGGARGQFAMLPYNLLVPGSFAQYVITGYWAQAAYSEAKLVGDARVASDVKEADGSYRRIPAQRELAIDPAARYLHLCSNNTIYGTQWHAYPDTASLSGVPLVADMTSDILSRVVDVSRFAMIYAGAQKNLGPSGVTAVIMRKDLIEQSRTDIPAIWRYSTHAQHASLYNTPTTFAITTMRHVLEHAAAIGGVAAIEALNVEKARRLYAALDARADYFRCPVAQDARSQMTVVFKAKDAEADARFLAEAKRRHMVGLAGHRSVGGIRASIYNWVGLDDIDALVELIQTFEVF